MFRKAIYVPAAIAATIGALVISVTLAATGPIVVNSTADTPDQTAGDGVCGSAAPASCTLRAAIQEANGAAGADEITFSVTGPINVTSALPAITGPLTITGPTGSITVNGNNTSSLLQYTGTTAATYSVSNLILTGGRAGLNARGGALLFAPSAGSVLNLSNVQMKGSATEGPVTGDGGALAIVGSGNQVFFTDGTVSGNTSASGSNGGGIYTEGLLKLDGVTVSGNTAGTPGATSPDGTGGGIYIATTGFVDLRNCTISGNNAKIGGGIAASASATGTSGMRNCTVANNTATQATSGGGISVPAGLFPGNIGKAFTSNIVAKNTANGAANNCAGAFSHTDSTYSGYNLSDETSCNFNQATDKQNVDPLLDTLADYGGLEQTLRIKVGSPAIDAGNPITSFCADQRGAPAAATNQAPAGTCGAVGSTIRRDIGAYEFGGFGVVEFTAANFPVKENQGSVTISVRRYGDLSAASSVTADAAVHAAGAGYATAADFTPKNAPLTWAAGDGATKTFNVSIIDDTLIEGDEKVDLILSALNKGADPGARFASPDAILTIQDWEEGLLRFKQGVGFGTLSGTAPSQVLTIARGEDGTGDTITVERVSGSNGPARVTFTTGSGTATSGADYTAVNTTITWADGDSTDKTVAVPIVDDTIYEDPAPAAVGNADNCDRDAETVSLSLSGASGARLGTTAGTSPDFFAATLNINDNDPAKTGNFSFSAPTYSVTEGTPNLTVTVQRLGGSDCAVSVAYNTTDIEALSGSDYTTASGTLGWTHGDGLTKTFTVPITNDTTREADETFRLDLSNPLPTQATIDAKTPPATGTVAPALGTPSTAVATIVSNTKLQFTFSAPSFTGNEGFSAAVTVKLADLTPAESAQTITAPVLISLSTADGTATSTDYTAPSPNPKTLTFGPATPAAGITTNIAITADGVLEPQEQFTASIASPDGEAGIVGTNPVPVIIPGSQQVVFSAAQYRSVNESGIITFAVKRLAGNNGSAGTVTVDYAIAPGTATQGVDYVLPGNATGQLTWNAGDTADKFIDINVMTDRVVEGDETILLSLSNASNALIGAPGTSTAIITDDDIDLVFASATPSVSEGAGTMAVAVKRLGTATGAASVNYATSNGTAISGTDYTAASGTLIWASGDVADKTVNVAIANNTRNQANKTFNLTLSNASANADAGPPSIATATIIDDDSVTVAFSAAAQTVSESAGMVTVTATRTGLTDFDITIPFTVSGTAVNPADHNASNGTITILAGASSGTYTFLVSDDSKDEAAETVIFTMGTPTGGNVSAATPGTQTVTITDNDVTTVSFSAATQVVGENVGLVTVTALRTGTTDFDISIPFAVSGTATNPADHNAVSGTISIPATATSGTVTFTVAQDSLDEANETVVLTMGTPTGGDVTAAAPASQTVTITDDDPTPTLSIGDVTVTEGDTTDVTMTFTVSLSAASGQAVAVNYATADGTAISPVDYTAVPSTVLNFTAGQTSRTFNVTVKSDSLDEPAETLTASLSSPVNATISRGTAIGTINDAADDVPPPPSGGGGAWGLPNLALLLGWWIRRRRLTPTL